MTQQRIDDLQLALDLALAWLIKQEPGDSRAVSNEFVAMAAISCDLKDLDECRQIIRDALARDKKASEPKEHKEQMSQCNMCGKLWPRAPAGYIHKCECSGGICHSVDP